MPTTAEAEHRRKVYIAARRGQMPQSQAMKLAEIGRMTAWRIDKAEGFVSGDGRPQAGRVRKKPAPIFKPEEHRPQESRASDAELALPRPGRTLADVDLDHNLDRDREAWAIPDDDDRPTDTRDLAMEAALTEQAVEGLKRIARPAEPEEPKTPTERLLGDRLEDPERHPAGRVESLPRGRYALGTRINAYGGPPRPLPRTRPPKPFVLRITGRG